MDDTNHTGNGIHRRSWAAIDKVQKGLSFGVREMRSANTPIRSPGR